MPQGTAIGSRNDSDQANRPMTATAPNRTLAAAGAIMVYAIIIGFTDNYVRVIAADAGLWQFHMVRTLMVLALIAVALRPLGLRIRPVSAARVAARSAVHGAGMLIYFGCLAFLPVAQVAAGLFTAPIFVLLISRVVYGTPIGPVRIAAVVLGFLGVLLMLAPGSQAPLGPASVFPVVAGAFYAMGNIATRQWCATESAEVLTLGFFGALGLAGTIGVVVLTLWPIDAPAGAAGFVLRGWGPLDATALGLIFVQAVGSLIGVGMMVKGYQLAEATRVAVFEYMILPFAALWGWLIWAEVLPPVAIVGMGLIAGAGVLIALRSTAPAPAAG